MVLSPGSALPRDFTPATAASKQSAHASGDKLGTAPAVAPNCRKKVP